MNNNNKNYDKKIEELENIVRKGFKFCLNNISDLEHENSSLRDEVMDLNNELKELRLKLNCQVFHQYGKPVRF